jgi:cobalt-zinc-cadmium efflux system outer membrane protein
VLPIQAVVDRVLARQSDLRLAALAVEGAQAAVVTAKALPNPRVDWQTGRYRPFHNGQAGDTAAWVLAQPIENPWMRQARRAAAEAGVDVGDIHRIRDREPVRPVA